MDIHSLIEEAKQQMLTDGKVMPMIYLELTQNVIMFALDILSDTQSIPEQCGILARLGWEECKKYPGQQPVSIGIYAEAWRVSGPENASDKMMPVRSKLRQEIIAVSFWHRDTGVQSCVLPVIRDHKKRVIDVGEEAITDHMSYQLAALLQGTRDAQKPDEEVFGRMEHALTQRLQNLTSEQLQELVRFLQEESER